MLSEVNKELNEYMQKSCDVYNLSQFEDFPIKKRIKCLKMFKKSTRNRNRFFESIGFAIFTSSVYDSAFLKIMLQRKNKFIQKTVVCSNKTKYSELNDTTI